MRLSDFKPGNFMHLRMHTSTMSNPEQDMQFGGEDMHHTSKEAILKLIDEKKNIEAEINRNHHVLLNNQIGMTEPLVDSEGYPRSDIDVYQVRHARHNIICLQNDHKCVMSRIEKKLNAFHEEIREVGALNIEMDEMNGLADPFVRVNLVSPGSPADLAGLQIEDQIIEFGSLNCTNFTNLQDVARIVQHSANVEITLKVRRRHQILQLPLTPKVWNGRGLLGCNIVPVESVER